jgi:hypothetical protein
MPLRRVRCADVFNSGIGTRRNADGADSRGDPIDLVRVPFPKRDPITKTPHDGPDDRDHAGIARRCFARRLAELLGPHGENEGRYVLVRGAEVRGPFPDRGEALAEGYKLYGTDPFLVKKIERVERLLHFPRGLP